MPACYYWDGNTLLICFSRLECITDLETFDVLWALAENDGA